MAGRMWLCKGPCDGRLKDIKNHMRSDMAGVQERMPRLEWKERHVAAVAELKRRQAEAKATAPPQKMREDARSEGQRAVKAACCRAELASIQVQGRNDARRRQQAVRPCSGKERVSHIRQ